MAVLEGCLISYSLPSAVTRAKLRPEAGRGQNLTSSRFLLIKVEVHCHSNLSLKTNSYKRKVWSRLQVNKNMPFSGRAHFIFQMEGPCDLRVSSLLHFF